MAGLKKHHPDLTFSGNLVTPDEIDRYEVYQVIMPGTNSAWWASAGTAGTSAVVPLVIINRLPDYPRNIRFAIAGSGAGMAGTLVANGYNQFGNEIQETISFGTAANGGTAVGTKVFAQLTSGTVYYGTAVGDGTPAIGFDTAGTTTKFGLPNKIAGTTDVVLISRLTGAGAQSVNGGTVAAFIDVDNHAFKAPADITGTTTLNVWYKSRYNAAGEANMTGLTLAV